ncbi:MAG TPA: rhomboid family intramembrane serine protease [Phnomibacter sp.]|nr:rhomboid family intramembrane serine protease [Phnomibacter sp.]
MTEFRPGRFQILPLVIKNLLIINGLVFLAQNTFDGTSPMGGIAVGYMANTFALHHVLSPLFQPWQLFTHMFMHGSFAHILGNMFVLWMFGSVLENLWGSKRFLIFYLICGLGAAMLHLGALYYENYQLLADYDAFRVAPTLNKYLDFVANYRVDAGYDGQPAYRIGRAWEAEPGNMQLAEQGMMMLNHYVNAALSRPTLGASGAVFGCLAAFAFLFPNTYIYLYFFVPIKAKWFVLLYVVFELTMAVNNSAGDNIARWAHLGGALVGFLLVYSWNKSNRRNFY